MSSKPKSRHESGESNTSGDSVSNYIPTPPDGGWGWVIVFASLMCNIIVDGIGYSFGVFLTEFVEYFEEPRSKVSLIGSLLCGVYLCAGPIVSGLTNRFGCRPVTVAGSIVASASFFLASFSPNVDILILTYGVMGGFGFGLIYLPSIVSVGYYFEKKRALATGIAVCGAGIGTFIFAPFTKYLLDEYDWRNALMLMSGIILNAAVCGMLMRPLEPQKKKRKGPRSKNMMDRIKEQAKAKRSRCSASECVDNNKIFEKVTEAKLERENRLADDESDVASLPSAIFVNGRQDSLRLQKLSVSDKGDSPSQPGSPTNVPKIVLQENGSAILESGSKHLKGVEGHEDESGFVTPPTSLASPNENEAGTKEMQNRDSVPKSRQNSTTTNTSNGIPKGFQPHEVEPLMKTAHVTPVPKVISHLKIGAAVGSSSNITKKDYARPLYRQDIFYSGSVLNIPQFRSQPNMRNYLTSITTIPGALPYEGRAVKEWKCCICLPKPVRDTLQEMLDISLFQDVGFMLICVGNVLAMLGFYVPFVFLVDKAVIMGVEAGQAALLLSAIGVTNTVGRIAIGFLADLPNMDSLVINNVALLIAGVAVMLAPFCNTYALMMVFACVFGICIAAYISLTSIIICDLLGLQKLTNAFGLLALTRGVSAILGPPLAGAVFQATGNYDASFYLGGAMIVAGGLLHCVLHLPCLKRNPVEIDIDYVFEDTPIGEGVKPELVTLDEIALSKRYNT